MKNKIFNAIQKGLSNVLVFDDSSISYQKTNISNNTVFPKVSLEELYDIFKDEQIDIFKYDTKDCLSLILDSGQEISLHEYKISDNPVFLKISNNLLKNTDNEIIIACNNNHYISKNKPEWATKYQQILPDNYLIKTENDAKNDFNGYSKCQIAINVISNNQSLDLPAIKYCNDIKSPLLNYKGYLPAIGQLYFIKKYLDMINYIFKYLCYKNLKLQSGEWWTSSEISYYEVCVLENGIGCFFVKSSIIKVLTLFHLEK